MGQGTGDRGQGTGSCVAAFLLSQEDPTVIFQLDVHCHDKLSFAELVQRISYKHSLNWQVKVNQDYAHDQRLPDERIEIPNISNHL